MYGWLAGCAPAQAQGIENIATKISQMGDVEGLPMLQPDEAEVVEWRGAIEAIVTANLAGPAEMLESFSEFSWLLAADEAEYAAEWKEAEHSLAETEAEIVRLAELAERVRGKSHRVVNFRLVQVDCSKARSTLAHKAERMRRSMQQLICELWQEKNADVCARFQAIQDKLLEQPTTTEAMNELETFMEVSQRRCTAAAHMQRSLPRRTSPAGGGAGRCAASGLMRSRPCAYTPGSIE